MDKYKTQIEQIKYTQKGKDILMMNIKKSKKTNNQIMKVALMIALFSTITVTVYAIPSPIEILSSIFGGSPAQTEVIDNIGVPVDASDTSNGITISAVAVIGDSRNVNIVYKITNEDGSPFVLPHENDRVIIDLGNTHKFKSTKYFGIGVYDDAKYINEDLTFVQTLNIDKTNSVLGDTFQTSIKSIVCLGDNDSIIEGNWNIKVNIDYLDSSEYIYVNQTAKVYDIEHTIKSIRISPVGMSIDYQSKDIRDVEIGLTPDGQINIDLPIKITKKDGSDFNKINSTSTQNIDGTADKNIFFMEILPLEEISTIQVGDVVVNVNL